MGFSKIFSYPTSGKSVSPLLVNLDYNNWIQDGEDCFYQEIQSDDAHIDGYEYTLIPRNLDSANFALSKYLQISVENEGYFKFIIYNDPEQWEDIYFDLVVSKAYREDIRSYGGLNYVSILSSDLVDEEGQGHNWENITNTFPTFNHRHTVTPASSNLKATASGVTVSGNGSVEAVTAIGDSTVAGTLGVDATFNTNVILDSTSIKATASGTTVGASGTDTFVRSYPGATSKLTTASITPCDPNNTVTALTNDTTFTAATFEPTVYSNGVLAFNFSGGALTKNTSTVAVKGVAAVVATGALSDSSATINVGASVMTGLGIANTANAVTGVTITAQPTVAIAAGTGAGAYNVVTGLNSASTTVNNSARVNAVTAIGTLTKNTVLTGVAVTNQPIVTLELNAIAGNGVVSVAVPTQVNTSTTPDPNAE